MKIEPELPLCAFVCCLLTQVNSAPAQECSGFVVGWGQNISGQATGTPSFAASNAMVLPSGTGFATGLVTVAYAPLTNVCAVSAGYSHSLAVLLNGTVVGWGDNSFGKAVGAPTPAPYRVSGPVRVGGALLTGPKSLVADRDFSLAISKDGSLVGWGENRVPERVPRVVGIAAEEGRSWALRDNGTVFGWATMPSAPDYARLIEVGGLSNIVAISVGPGGYGTRGLAITRQGTVATWGTESTDKDAAPPSGLSNVIALAAGGGHSLALRADGTVIGWGHNAVGEATGVPNTKAPHISSGAVHLDGEMLTNVSSIAASRGYSLALKKDGTVVSWGRMVNDQYPATVPAGLSNVIAISAGESFCLAITTNPVVAERFRAK
jgi:hypothetical protein